MKEGENLQEQVIDALRDVPSGLTSRRIHSLINNVGIQEIASSLRHLQSSGHVQLTGGTVWRWTGKIYITPAHLIPKKGENVEETRQINSSNHPDLAQQATKIEILQNTRWDEFRRLCLYYAECIRLDDRAKVHSYTDKEGRGFVTLTGFLNFQPLASGRILHVEIKAKWAKFLRTIHRRKSNPRFYIAYPIHVYVFKDKTSGENKQGLYPIFVQQVECKFPANCILRNSLKS
jgi:hypothetical protein